MGAYSNLADLVRGFDGGVLRMGFRVSVKTPTPPLLELELGHGGCALIALLFHS